MQISVQNLTKQYPGGKTALKYINLDVNSGMFGLLGPNGAYFGYFGDRPEF